MIFKINGALSDDSSNPTIHTDHSTVIIIHSCNTKNEFTRILGIKKEPYGSDVKNIK